MSRVIVVVASAVIALAACSGGPSQESGPGSASKAAPAAVPAVTSASAAAAGVPNWVPIYPGAQVSGVETRNTGVETWTTFNLDTPADCEKVFAWYDEALKVAGFNVSKTASTLQGHCTGSMRADSGGHTRGVGLSSGGPAGGPSRIGVRVVVRDLPGTQPPPGDARVPSWVPQYPGSKTANLVVREVGTERSADFSFVTTDDAQKVIGWYERTLTAANFTVVSSTVFDTSTAKFTAQDARGRSILNIRMEPAGGRKVVAVEAREIGP